MFNQEETRLEPGTYEFVCKIVEVRDLVAADVNGTSDPAVYICLNTKKEKKVFSTAKQSTLSCVFDEEIILKAEMTQEDLDSGSLRLAVVDSDISTAVAMDMIGCYDFPARSLYQRDGHEFHRQWFGLVDLDKPDECNKVRGFIKASVTMLKIGDKQKSHDETKQMEDELREEQLMGGYGNMALMPQVIRKEEFWLVVTLHAVDGIPGVDKKKFGKGSKTDIVLSCKLDPDQPPSKSQHLTVDCGGAKTSRLQGHSCLVERSEFDAEKERGNGWVQQELRQLVSLPTATKNIQLGLWDHDTWGDECLGHEYMVRGVRVGFLEPPPSLPS
jgi:hypothetical protein